MLRIILAVMLTAASLPTALAEQVSITVSANRKSEIYSHAVYQKHTCLAGAIPVMSVGRKPKNGTVTFQKTTFKLTKDAGSCAGKSIKGTSILYTPNRNFRGRDKFTVNFSYETYPGSSKRYSSSSTYDITVK